MVARSAISAGRSIYSKGNAERSRVADYGKDFEGITILDLVPTFADKLLPRGRKYVSYTPTPFLRRLYGTDPRDIKCQIGVLTAEGDPTIVKPFSGTFIATRSHQHLSPGMRQ